MSTVTSTLAVNAAFLQEIKEDNTQLQQMLQTLESELGGPRPCRVSLSWLHQHLEALREQLAVHFSLEETFGYFEDAVSVAPRLSIRADRLQAEHGALAGQLCELLECVAVSMDRDNTQLSIDHVGDGFLKFHQRFRQHENEENKLIMQAFGEDIGVGD